MAATAAPTMPMTRASRLAAGLSLGAAAAFLSLLALLHVVKGSVDPSWHFISEYELGDNGWMMVLAFLCLAVSCVALIAAIRSQVRTIAGRIGLVLLLVSALGMVVAALFVTDPQTADRGGVTTHGQLHQLGAMLDSVAAAAVLVSWSLARRNRAWHPNRWLLMAAAGLALAANVAWVASLIAMFPRDGVFGPGVLLGWPNRALVVSQALWLMAVAWRALELPPVRPPGDQTRPPSRRSAPVS